MCVCVCVCVYVCVCVCVQFLHVLFTVRRIAGMPTGNRLGSHREQREGERGMHSGVEAKRLNHGGTQWYACKETEGLNEGGLV